MRNDPWDGKGFEVNAKATDAVAVTVVVPTYRRPRQLQECLEALAAQRLEEPWDVVVVDDGSPGPPDPGVESLVAARGWRLVRQANAGPSAARNRGVREARGEFIAFTDDDCLPEPAWLETLLRAARNRQNALVGGTTVNGLTSDFFASTSQLIVDLVYEHFNADPDDGYFLASNNILCSRAWFQDVGGFDESFPRAGADAVAGEGYRSGRSFHRAPLRSTHRMPSKQRRSSTRLRPPFFEGFRFGMSGSILDHCSSVSSDAWRLIERLLSISLVAASPCRAQAWN